MMKRELPAIYIQKDPREPQLATQAVKDLCVAVSRLESPFETKQFLRDLCTISEIVEMATRWQIVRLLQSGTPYTDIAKKTGASTATVTRVANWLHHGLGGYRLMLERLGFHRPRAIH